MNSNIDPKRMIRRILENERSNREDNLNRAKMQYRRSPHATQLLKDYQDDVDNINTAISYFDEVSR